MEEFYTVEDCEEAVSIIHNIEDCIKFVYSCHSSTLSSPEAVELTEELKEAYFNIREACLELVNAFDYYNTVHAAPFTASEDELVYEIANRTKAYSAHKDSHFVKVLKYEE